MGDVLSTAMRLGNTQQLELFAKLAHMLVGEGLLPGERGGREGFVEVWSVQLLGSQAGGCGVRCNNRLHESVSAKSRTGLLV